ncbi:CopD family protein [Cytophagales bacterium LB-30]|uniref:Protoporphyrinogen IX oxidase n=1 Tax=Shiella aurantiaca TaxID=3058365 RepID=A0ABT8F767_9BACT|nr:CopD family protein [Shiella aurantiaca]MDN4166300.1 CopD family protein [Shiella aurantiaca]
MSFQLLKALHIIFIVTWFAGLFYIVRLFIYQREALDAPEPEKSILGKQLKTMANRLWFIITWPSAIITLVLGPTLIFYPPFNYYQFMPTWLWLKLGFVVLLFVYHLYCHFIYKQLQKDVPFWNSQKLRVFNEGATLLLFAIVFLVVLKSGLDTLWGILGLIGLGVTLMLAISLYKRSRK